MFKHFLLILSIPIVLSSCIRKKTSVELLVYNAKVYTVDETFRIVDAFVVSDGKIVEIGKFKKIINKYSAKSVLNLEGKYVYPGFIDAHCHFFGYGRNLSRLDLRDTKSFQEVIDKTYEYSKMNASEWIIGRGWDQNNWDDKNFPSMEPLNKLFPDRPIILYRVDGHAALVNAEALRRAKIPVTGIEVQGGTFIKTNNILTGILIDNAIDLINAVIPTTNDYEIIQSLLQAQEKCFGVGLTSVHDAGLDLQLMKIIDSLHKSGELQIRIYCMLNPDEKTKNFFLENGHYLTDYLSVRSVKLYADGALGSKGACLLEPYSGADHCGLMLNNLNYFEEWCQFAQKYNLQVCTHAIGDSANRVMLNLYQKTLKNDLDKRWRIEHAQVLHPSDCKLFDNDNIVPSVQPTHATSDMYWAEERLGPSRIQYAYTYKTLLDICGWLPLGSDFPVEDINPLYGFYAAVSRKDLNGYPKEGFMINEALDRKEALHGMTIWAAKAAFEENTKGSIEAGKFADFVVLDEDIMAVDASRLPLIRINMTFINGRMVYESKH